MLGYTADELRGKSFAAITHPDDLKASMRLFKAAIAGKQSRVHLEKRLFRKDGRTVWIALNCHLHRDAAGKPFFMISLFENITERKRRKRRCVSPKPSTAGCTRASVTPTPAWT